VEERPKEYLPEMKPGYQLMDVIGGGDETWALARKRWVYL